MGSLNVDISTNVDQVSFDKVSIGDTFEYEGAIYLKCCMENESYRYIKLSGETNDDKDDFKIYDLSSLPGHTFIKVLSSTLTIDKIESQSSLQLIKALSIVNPAIDRIYTKIDSGSGDISEYTANYIKSTLQNTLTSHGITDVEVVVHDFVKVDPTISNSGNIACVVHLNIDNLSRSIDFNKIVNKISDPKWVSFERASKITSGYLESYTPTNSLTAESFKTLLTSILVSNGFTLDDSKNTEDNYINIDIRNYNITEATRDKYGIVLCDIFIGNIRYTNTIKYMKEINTI